MLSCTILFSYVAMCSYIMFHFATRAFKLRSFFYVRARCCNIRIAHPRTWGRTSELNQVKCFFFSCSNHTKFVKNDNNIYNIKSAETA